MAKREKKTIITGVTREQMETAFGAYAEATAQAAQIMAALEKKIVELREAASNDLAKWTDQKEQARAKIEAFAMEHRADLFAKTKSLKTVHGVLGFRTGMPRLQRRRGFTWAVVLELLKVKAPSYVKTTEDVAKDRLLADRDNEVLAALMPSLGIEVVQDETFYIEPKTEDSTKK